MSGWGSNNDGGWNALEKADNSSNSGGGWSNGWGEKTNETASKPAPAAQIPKKLIENKSTTTANKSGTSLSIPVQVSKSSAVIVMSHLSEQQNISTDMLRMLVNHHAQDTVRNSFQDHVSDILFTPGQDIAFVKMMTSEVTQRVQDRLNGAKCFDKEIFCAIAPNQICFKNSATVTEPVNNSAEILQQQSFRAAPTPHPQTTNQGSGAQKSDKQPEKEVFQDNSLTGTSTKPKSEQQQQRSNANSWGMTITSETEKSKTIEDSWATNTSEDQNQQKKADQQQPASDPWSRSAAVWDEEPDTWGKPKNTANKTENAGAQEKSTSNVGWGGEKNSTGYGCNNNGKDNRMGGRGIFQNNGQQNTDGFANSKPFSGNNRDQGRGGGRGRGGARRDWNGQNQENRNDDNRSETQERSGSGRGRDGFSFKNTNFVDRQTLGEGEGQRRFDNKTGGNGLYGNPDNHQRGGGGFRTGRGGRNDFSSGNRNFVQNGFHQRNQNSQQNNWNTDQSEQQQNETNNSNWGQPSQKVFYNNDFRPPSHNEPEGDAPPSKVIIISGLDAETKRQDLFDLLFSKTQTLIDYSLQRYNSGLFGQPPKAFLLVEFTDVAEATHAIEQLKDVDFMGIKLMPKFSRKQTINVGSSIVREYRHRNRYGDGDNHSAVSGNTSPNPNSTHSSPKNALVKNEADNKQEIKEELVEDQKEDKANGEEEGKKNKLAEIKNNDEKKQKENGEEAQTKKNEGGKAVEKAIPATEEHQEMQENSEVENKKANNEKPKVEESEKKAEEEQMMEHQGEESSGNTSSVSTAEMMTTTSGSGDSEEKGSNIEESDEEKKVKVVLVMSPKPTTVADETKKNENEVMGEEKHEPEMETQSEEDVEEKSKKLADEKNDCTPQTTTSGEDESNFNSCSSGVEEDEKENKEKNMEEDADLEPPVY